VYTEFNIDAKLAGTPEERAAGLQLAVGRPWRTVNEARALENLPRIDDPEMDTVAPQQGGPAASAGDPDPRTVDAVPVDETAAAIAPVLEAARARQQARLSKSTQVPTDFYAEIDRWNRELTQDLTPLVGAVNAERLAIRANLATFAALNAGETTP